MGKLKGTKTAENLMISYMNETSATLRYEYYAKQAKKDGYVQIQNIFEETAMNEEQHAKRFFRFLTEDEDIQDTKVEINFAYPAAFHEEEGGTLDNLKAAQQGEHEEFLELYPGFADTAEEEGFPEIAHAWRMIAKVEDKHERRFAKLIENIENDKVFRKDEVVRWKCNKCGYIHEGKEAINKCPACLHPQSYFEVFVETY